MRRYDDPVEVRKGLVGAVEAPEQFLWRGRLWKVRDVIAHWVETGPWWQSSGASPDLLGERELWRVEAGIGVLAGGVFDLSFSWSDGNWQLVGCVD